MDDVFINDYVYPDHNTKIKRKPRPKFSLESKSKKTKKILMGFDSQNEKYDTEGTKDESSNTQET